LGVNYCIGIGNGFDALFLSLKALDIGPSGQFTIKLNDGYSELNFQLSNPKLALYVPEGFWRELVDFPDDCICFFLASDYYDKILISLNLKNSLNGKG
jgi:hypothetical protein